MAFSQVHNLALNHRRDSAKVISLQRNETPGKKIN